MKIKGIVICLAGLFAVATQASTATEHWTAKSIDKQYGQFQASAEKTSDPEGANSNPLTQSLATTKSSPASGVKTSPLVQGQEAQSLSFRPQVKNDNGDFWVYDATVTLHGDSDYDGYFHHFSVEFDVDSYFVHADVYARLYLGVGEEFREFHTTSVFAVDGQSSDDTFTVESELLTGFYPQDYELLIEIYDAYDDHLVAVYDGYDDADLYLLSLESSDYEEVYIEPDVVVVHASGGSLGWFGLLLLVFAAIKMSTRIANR